MFAAKLICFMTLFVFHQMMLVDESSAAGLTNNFPNVTVHMCIQECKIVKSFSANMARKHSIYSIQVELCYAIAGCTEFLSVIFF